MNRRQQIGFCMMWLVLIGFMCWVGYGAFAAIVKMSGWGCAVLVSIPVAVLLLGVLLFMMPVRRTKE